MKARELIEEPGAWIQYVAARDAVGGLVTPRSDEAVSFCPIGALARVCENLNIGNCYHPTYIAAAGLLRTQMGNSIGIWNDHRERTHDEVLAAFDRAIADA